MGAVRRFVHAERKSLPERSPMPPKKKTKLAPRKLGDDRSEIAVKPRKLKANFKESRDVREDRGTRQTKLGRRK